MPVSAFPSLSRRLKTVILAANKDYLLDEQGVKASDKNGAVMETSLHQAMGPLFYAFQPSEFHLFPEVSSYFPQEENSPKEEAPENIGRPLWKGQESGIFPSDISFFQN